MGGVVVVCYCLRFVNAKMAAIACPTEGPYSPWRTAGTKKNRVSREDLKPGECFSTTRLQVLVRYSRCLRPRRPGDDYDSIRWYQEPWRPPSSLASRLNIWPRLFLSSFTYPMQVLTADDRWQDLLQPSRRSARIYDRLGANTRTTGPSKKCSRPPSRSGSTPGRAAAASGGVKSSERASGVTIGGALRPWKVGEPNVLRTVACTAVAPAVPVDTRGR